MIVPFHKQHGKGAEKPFKLCRLHLYHTCWYRIRILSLKKSVLLICKMLRLFVNTFTADDKYFSVLRGNFTQPIHIQLLQKRKTFSRFHAAFSTSRLNFQHFQKRLTLIANIFPKLQTLKEGLRSVSKKCCFIVPF